MCWMCDRPEATFADYVDEVLQPIIDVCGWAVQAVGGTRVHAPFSYTVGLTVLGLPELVITGKGVAESAAVLNTFALQSLPPPGSLVDGPFEVVALPHPEAHLFVATGMYGEDRVTGLQLVWPDARGCWPWDQRSRGGQPVLGPRAVRLAS